MSTKRIEQLIEEIFEFVESCKPSAFSGSKVIVPKEELYDLLDELRLKVPEEIKRCQKMIANRDAIIADAEDKAAAIEQSARQQAQLLVNENEITQQAYYQANEMVRQATEQAEEMLQQAEQEAIQIRQGALGYTNDMLSRVEQVLTSSYEITKNRSDAMLEALRQNLEIVTANRRELGEDIAPQAAESVNQAAGARDEDFDFDENIFLDNVDNEE
ncbi:MAG: ATPase [Lachnospiraceae bacterium]|nr:ATPase [Lachnospiraceae bacterium]